MPAAKLSLTNPTLVPGPFDTPALMRGSLVQSYPRTGSFLILGPEMPGEGCSRDAKQPGGASLVTARLIVNKFHVTGDGRGERKVAHVRFPVRRELRIALQCDRRRVGFQVRQEKPRAQGE